ncbi:SMI1/KNR4 family protein [Vibrio sp. Of7-15]|uniref:SMI1/KNR4 family protein n=1 Tax=Vibrio sp. Of7-15 TaxID=2724879 RepID=UPI001EF36019|nr:SMI1/KNR4 family protein [Vibrio sp. Of7-15]MCG7500015.1 SMI1/KNR4 family protein [Vibrio sp. Of7-15]
MTEISFKKGTSCEPVTDEHLEEAEEFFDEFIGGKRFPNALIELLKKNNGGTPVQKFFKTPTNEHPIREFLNLSFDDTIILHESNNIFSSWEFYQDRFNNPNLVPIADTRFGDVIVLDYEGTPKNDPRVALWFHECDENGVNSHPLEPIAENMESFLSMLTADFEE